MARIRTVKPEFYTHPEILRLSIPARLLLIALFNQADDEGRLYDQPMKIAGEAFGEDDRVNVPRLLGELESAQRILRYEVDERRCIQVVNFDRHQSISHPRPSSIPGAFTEVSGNGSGPSPGGLQEASGGEGNREQGTGNGKEQGTGKAAGAAAFDRFWAAYPRKVGKPKARKAFEQALHRATAEEIIAGAERYRDDPNRSDAYTAHPTTWLNRDGWGDDPEPPRRGGSRVPHHED